MLLISFIILYLLVSIGIGLYAATRVKNTADYAVAGRSLPLYIVIATTFATWFGSETVLGVSAKFVQGGLGAVVEDPIGASMCLVLVGLFFAYKLYRMNLLTIGDYYRRRYGKVVEVVCSLIILVSYLGWVAAQITALGFVFSELSQGAITMQVGMVIGTGVVLFYTLFGGMWSVALTDFFQMIIIVVGLVVIAFMAGQMAGGADKVIALASSKDMFRVLPEPNWHDMVFFFAAAITMMLGSIPQQDVFQRVMSSKDERTARLGPVIGGLGYLAFAFVPMFIVTAAMIVMPEQAATLLSEDSQRVLPQFILQKMPPLAQVFFFGALLSAIMSTASATLLAPSTTFVENILKNVVAMSDKRELLYMRVTVVVFTTLVLCYALSMEGTPIYEMVSGAYQVTLVGAFIPLVFGLYWKRATTQGAIASIVFGIATWVLMLATPLADEFPAQLAGILVALVAMIIGSLLPQRMRTPAHAHEAG